MTILAADAASALRACHEAKILAALSKGPAGCSWIANRAGMHASQVNKRTPQMLEDGRIRLTGRRVVSTSGRSEREWEAV